MYSKFKPLSVADIHQNQHLQEMILHLGQNLKMKLFVYLKRVSDVTHNSSCRMTKVRPKNESLKSSIISDDRIRRQWAIFLNKRFVFFSKTWDYEPARRRLDLRDIKETLITFPHRQKHAKHHGTQLE